MPNHVTNRIHLIGDQKRIDGLMEAVRYENQPLGTMDFNKIIPMPNNIFRGSLGQRELQLYGKNNWYDWSIANWGSKWNSFSPQPLEKNTLTFSTAWSNVMPILEALAQQYPDLDIEYRWADEDIGCNVGMASFSGGEMTSLHFPEVQSKEAFEMAAEIRGIQLADYCLSYNEEIGTYEYDENLEESMEMGGM